MAKVLLTLILCFGGASAFANEPESPGIPANCEITDSTMDQRLVNNNGGILTQKTVTLQNLKFTSVVPGVDYKSDSVTLTGGGISVDGEHFGFESKDIWIDATVKSEVVSGRVNLNVVHVFRKLEGKMEKFDCKLTVKESSATKGEESSNPRIAK